MDKPKFVYVTYIRSTPEKVWEALTDPKFTRQYWMEIWQDCDWKKGSSWKMVRADGFVMTSGKVLEVDRPRKLVLEWTESFKPELKGDGPTKMTYEIEQQKEMVKLTVIHESDKPSKTMTAVSNGWPLVLASLKSLLETGDSLESTRKWPKGDDCMAKS